MTDLATLGVRIDTSGVESAIDPLDNFAKSAETAEDAVNQLGTTSQKAGQGVSTYAAEIQQAYGLNQKLTDSEVAVIAALEDQINYLSLSREEQAALNAIRISGTKVDSEARVVIESLARSYAMLADAQKEAAKAQDKVAQQNLNDLLTGPKSEKSARDSASVFLPDIERAETEMLRLIQIDSQRAAQSKKTSDVIAAALTQEVKQLNEVAKLKAQQAGQNFAADLKDRLGLDAVPKSARDSADAFKELLPPMDGVSDKSGVLKRDVRELIQIMQFSSGPLGLFARGISNLTFGFGRFGLAVVGGIAAFGSLSAGAYKAVQAYRVLEEAQIRVRNRLALTGGASGQNVDSIEALVRQNASFGQNTTAELREAAAELLKFRNVSGETFSQTLELANRFSQTGLMKVAEAARLMGSALKNPIEGVQQLRDAGLSISPVLEDTIRKLYEQGRVLEAQRALYAAVANQLGGVTGGQGLAGAWTQVSNSSSGFFEKFGGWISSTSDLEGELRRLANIIDYLTGATDRASTSNGWSWFFRNIAAVAGNTRPLANALATAAQDQMNRRPPRNAAEAERRINEQLSNPDAYQRSLRMQQDVVRGFQPLFGAIAQANQLRKEEQDRINGVKLALSEELRVAGMSAVQQRIDTELRKAGVDAMSDEGKAIARLVTGIEALQFARETRDDLRRRLADAQTEVRTVGMTAEAAERYRIVQERLNEARIRGIAPSEQTIAAWDKEAAAIARANQAAREANLLKDIRFERDQIGRNETEQRIAQALRQAGDVNPNSVSGQLIANQVRLNEELRISKDLTLDFTSTFTSEFRSALREGENFWSAFSSAGLKALQRVADKLLDMALQDLVTKAFGGVNFFSLTGGSSSVGVASTGFDAWSGLRMATGGVFNRSGVTAFANGGAFTNSIVSSPTLFKFAQGIGLMGEAGPEAIVPLKRMSNGNLGVQAANDNRLFQSQGLQRIHVTVGWSRTADGNLRPFVESVAQETAGQAVSTGIEEYDRALPDRVNQIENGPRRRRAAGV